MKQLTSKLWAKLTAMILITFCAAIAVLSVVGVCYLVDQRAYVKLPEHVVRESISYGSFYSYMNDAESYYQLLLREKKEGADIRSYLSYYQEYFAPDHVNFFFTVSDTDGKLLFESEGANRDYRYKYASERTITYNWREESETRDFADEESYLAYLDSLDQQNFSLISSDYTVDEEGIVHAVLRYNRFDFDTVTITGYIPAELTAQDEIYTQQAIMTWLVSMRSWLIVIAVASVIATLALLVFLLCAAGHKEGLEGITPNWLDKLPYDLYLAADIFLIALILYACVDGFGYSTVGIILAFCICAATLTPLVMGALMTSATRFKLGKWWRNTVIFYVCRLIWRACRYLVRGARHFVHALPAIWQMVLLWCGYCLIELILVIGAASAYDASGWVALWFLFYLALTLGVVLLSIQLRKIQAGGKALAGGDLDYSIDTKHMHLALREHAENLNSIAGGMQKAVASQMRSERFRTELITNVSHDIKTPLTSIVNYVDLLKKEDVQPEKAREYIDVLDRQSARLKKLTVDLVEASKASTGALPVNLEPTDVNVLLGQVAGEYLDRLEGAGLEPVFKPDPSAPKIMADGKLIWRVFDNLLSNVCKYAMPGTRMYFSSERKDGKVVITFRNISKYALDISADELMERFVRGDASRSTEGSGLGLSIAQSLTQLQKGEFRLDIDGDLFKAIVTFDELKE